jgi:phosphoglycolate phosphatase-like HAD superfamily hydrolase
MFPKLQNNIIYALDLDGVIIDSIDECFKICSTIYLADNKQKNEIKELFYKYRGLVGPAYQYYYLMTSIGQFINSREISIQDYFYNLKKVRMNEKAQIFEKDFFANRRKLQKFNFDKWIALNPLTNFGKYIQKTNPNNVIIVTTKNKDSAELILKHYKIHPQNIYGNDDVRMAGSKGNLLNILLEESNLNRMIFIDDAIEHLSSVNNNNIECFFAEWGYGENNHEYNSFKI